MIIDAELLAKCTCSAIILKAKHAPAKVIKTIKAIKVKDIKRAKAAKKGAAIYKVNKEATIVEVAIEEVKIKKPAIKSSMKVSLKSKVIKTALKKKKELVLVIDISSNIKDSSVSLTDEEERSFISE